MAATEIPQETQRGYNVKAISFDPPITSNLISNPETIIYSKSIEGGKMGTAKEMTFSINCSLTTGIVAPPLTINVKLGIASLTVAGGIGITTNLGTPAPFRIEGAIINMLATNKQYVWAKILTPTSTVPLILNTAASYVSSKWTIDTTTDQTFAITAKFGSLLLGTSLQTEYVKIELS